MYAAMGGQGRLAYYVRSMGRSPEAAPSPVVVDVGPLQSYNPWGSPYGAVKFSAMPFCDLAFLLDEHLLTATWEKYCKVEYVDWFSLLY